MPQSTESRSKTSPSELNKRVTWQYKTRVPDGMGGFTETYVDACTTWSAIWPVSANEIIVANSISMVVSHRIRIRYRSTFKSSWRGKFGNRYFAIAGITNPNESNEFLDVMCKEAA
jgi:SPP1 family predicted phage head-tail adaptor